MLLYTYKAPGQGQTTPWGQMLMSTESPYHFAHLLQVLKQFLWSMILNTFWMILYMYIAPGQGQTTIWGQNFDVKFLITLDICCQFKEKSLWSLIFNVFFFLHMYIAPGRDRQPIGDKTFMTTERPFLFAHMLRVSKWSLRNLILYTFLMLIHMYIAPRHRQKTPWGQTFDVNRKPLPLRPFVANFKQISLNSDFILIF